MSMLIRYFSSFALLLAGIGLLLSATASHASATAEQTSHQQWLQLADAQAKISKGQAARAAQSKHGGKVLSVSQSGGNYRVKLLKDSGKVIIVIVDGQSGSVR